MIGLSAVQGDHTLCLAPSDIPFLGPRRFWARPHPLSDHQRFRAIQPPQTPIFRYPAILDDHDRRGSLFLDHWGFWPSMARRGHTWTPSDIPFLDYRRFWTFLIGLDALPGDSSAPCTRHKLCLAPPTSRDYWVWRTPHFTRLLGDRWVAVCDHSGLWGGVGPPLYDRRGCRAQRGSPSGTTFLDYQGSGRFRRAVDPLSPILSDSGCS